MPEKYQNKYRVPSARHQHCDYRWLGSYFITICTHQQNHYFGKIIDGKMKLSSVGVIADLMWYEISHHAKNIKLGKFVVMPNHIHGILTVQKNDDEINDTTLETRHVLSLPEDDPNSKRNPPTNYRRIQIPKTRQEFHLHHHRWLQINRNSPRQSTRIELQMANPISRSHHQK